MNLETSNDKEESSSRSGLTCGNDLRKMKGGQPWTWAALGATPRQRQVPRLACHLHWWCLDLTNAKEIIMPENSVNGSIMLYKCCLVSHKTRDTSGGVLRLHCHYTVLSCRYPSRQPSCSKTR